MRTVMVLISILLSFGIFSACSGGGDDEQGVIETKTKEIGQEAVRMIKTPVDKAQAVADREAKRAQEMDRQRSE